MEQPPAPVRVIPENALVHFALTQRQHAAVLAATKFFAMKLRDPHEREIAQSAWAAMSVITEFSLPSEGRGGDDVAKEVMPIGGQTDVPRQASETTGGASVTRDLRPRRNAQARETAEKAFAGAKGLAALQRGNER